MIPQGIVLHFTASTYGDAAQIDQWHKAQGWSGIGYHYVVLNGRRNNGGTYSQLLDGKLENGRPENVMGAHCKANGMNQCTVGISCVGTPNAVPAGAVAAPGSLTTAAYLTAKQLDTMVQVTARLCVKYGLDPAGTFVHPGTGGRHPVITQHSQHDPAKPLCASLQIAAVRQRIATEAGRLKSPSVLAAENDDDPSATVFGMTSATVPNPQAIEATLPEFTTEMGNATGPADLSTDVEPHLLQQLLKTPER